MKWHLCLDVDVPQRTPLTLALRSAADAHSDGKVAGALNTLADAVAEAERVPAGTLAKFSIVEAPGEGLTIPDDRRVPTGEFFDQALGVAGGRGPARVARLAVVAHVVRTRRGRR